MSSAGIPVKIKLLTNIKQNDQEDTFELILFGRYYKKGKTSYLLYDEVQDQGTIHTTVKFDEESAQITRKGAVNMRLSFHKEKLKSGTYNTDIGTLIIGTHTEKFDFQWDNVEKQGSISLRYKFFMEDMEIGTYFMSFEFEEVNTQ